MVIARINRGSAKQELTTVSLFECRREMFFSNFQREKTPRAAALWTPALSTASLFPHAAYGGKHALDFVLALFVRR